MDAKLRVIVADDERPARLFLLNLVHLLPKGPGPLVAFVTAFDGYRDLAQEVGVFEYLLKPVTRQRLRSALTHARELESEAWSRVAN